MGQERKGEKVSVGAGMRQVGRKNTAGNAEVRQLGE